MSTKDIKKITLAKSRGSLTHYKITDMDGMCEINIDGKSFVVDDEINHDHAKWLQDNWVKDETDEEKNAYKYTMKIKKGN